MRYEVDLGEFDPADAVRHLRRMGHGCVCSVIADQIDAQVKPPRIPEPGKYGVVRDASGEEWVRTGPTQHTSHEWLNTETADSDDWAGIKDPTLIRDGIEESS